MRPAITAYFAWILLASACAPPTGEPESLRIATFNTYLLSPVFRCPPPLLFVPDCVSQIEWPVPPLGEGYSCTPPNVGICDGISEEWARNIAAAVLEDPDFIDVLALNEVWDEDARTILIERLAPHYVPIIAKVDAPLITFDGLAGEDSGLMLFARADFVVEPLPNDDFEWGDPPDEILSAASSNVAFVRFDACEGSDCHAAKGAAFVRLRRASGSRIYNIVLTHMQADYPLENQFYPTARAKQLFEIENMLRGTLGRVEQRLNDGEVLVMLGDLNVPYLKTSDPEWEARFGAGSGFFGGTLYESWHFTSSQADLTPTNGLDAERLDYIFAGPGPPTEQTANARLPCVQHVTVPERFRLLQSDHHMVHADVNRAAPHCSPSLAFKVDLTDARNEHVIDESAAPQWKATTRIEQAGGMQWFYVNATEPGSYSIGLDNAADVVLDVFLPDNLTVPYARYYADASARTPQGYRQQFTVHQYALPKEFFIRARGVDRQKVADYALLIVRHACSSKEDACLLAPEQMQTAQLASANDAQTVLVPQNEAWFRFDAFGAAGSGAPQTLTVTAGIADASRVSVTLDELTDPLGSTSLSATAFLNTVELKGPVGAGGYGYLVARQSSPAPQRTSISATLSSNLRFLEVNRLICYDETNPELGSDDIFSEFRIDGIVGRAPASGDMEFDCDESRHPRDWRFALPPNGRTAYVESAAVRVQEGDDASSDDESAFKAVEALAPGAMNATAILKWNFDDGEYWLEHTVRRRPNEPVATAP